MMTFKDLKKLVELPSYKEQRVPTVKALEVSGVPVVTEKVLENHGSINVYQNGYVMDFLAKYTMPIFLMHTLFAAPLRSVLLKVGVTNAVAHVVLGLGISFAGPIIAAWIMKKTKWMEFFLYPNKLIRKVS